MQSQPGQKGRPRTTFLLKTIIHGTHGKLADVQHRDARVPLRYYLGVEIIRNGHVRVYVPECELAADRYLSNLDPVHLLPAVVGQLGLVVEVVLHGRRRRHLGILVHNLPRNRRVPPRWLRKLPRLPTIHDPVQSDVRPDVRLCQCAGLVVLRDLLVHAK